jgi:predicted RNA binding protein YcfA (HicA-like mRNA interferase family)
MASTEKTLESVLSGRSDPNIRFSALCRLLDRLGFQSRTKGGHHIYYKENVIEILNLQPRPDGKAKPYQVKQVRNAIVKYGLSL